MCMCVYLPLLESKELLDELDTIDELDSSEIFDGFDGDSSMWPTLEGTTCCSIVFKLVVESGGELDEELF